MNEEDKKDPGPQVKFIDEKPVGSSYNLDADTIMVDNQSYRISGFNAPETAKDKAGMIIPNQYQGDRTQEFVNRFAEEGKYDRMEVLGKDPAFPNRMLASQLNLEGDDLGSALTRLGVVAPTVHSNPEDVSSRLLSGSIGRLFSSADENDPLRAIAAEKKTYDKSQGVSFLPTRNVATAAEYATFQNSIGATAAAKAADEVLRLQNILDKEEMSDATRSDLTKKLNEAKGQLLYAAMTPRIFGGVNYLPEDRNKMNQAKGFVNQTLSAWNVGTNMFAKGLGGILELAGEESEWDYLSKKGKQLQLESFLKEANLPTFVSTISDIDTSDPWSAVADTGLFLTNNLATMIPLWGSALAAGGVATMLGTPGLVAAGISTIPGWITYSGGMYADQPEDRKNSGQALGLGLTAAVLDRLGLEAIFSKQIGSVLTKEGKDKLVNLISTKFGLSTADATQEAMKYTKGALVEAAKFSSAFAKSQAMSMEYATKALARTAGAGLSEGVTETAQTAMELVAATGQWNLDARYQKDFNQQLIDSFIAGKAIGGVIHGAGEVKLAAQLHSAVNQHEMSTKDMNDVQLAQQQLREDFESFGGNQGLNFDTETITSQIAAEAHDFNPSNPKSVDEAPKMSTVEGFLNIITSPLRLLRGHAKQMTPNLFDENGKLLKHRATIQAIMGGFGIIPGQHYSGYKRAQLGALSSTHTSSENLASEMKVSPTEAGNIILSAVNKFWSKGLDTPTDHPHFETLNRYHQELKTLDQAMKQLARESGITDTSIFSDNALFVPEVDKLSLGKNRSLVAEKLVASGLTRRKANKVIDDILSGNKVKIGDASQIMSDAGIYKDTDLDHVFEKNYFNSLENIKERLAAAASVKKFIGKRGEILFKLADKADKNGEFKNEAEKKRFLSEIKDYFDMVEGSYNTLDRYPTFKKAMGWWTTLTMLAMLGKAGLSSLPEVAFSLLGTRGEKVSDQLKLWSRNFFNEIGDDAFTRSNSYVATGLSIAKLNNLATKTADIKLKERIAKLEEELRNVSSAKEGADLQKRLESMYEEYIGRKLYDDLGFSETGYNTQSRFEYADNSMRNVMALFAKITGLKQTTEATRMAALSIASDTVASYIEAVRDVPKTDLINAKNLTNFQFQALRELQAYGMDVPMVMDFLNKTNTGLQDISSRYEFHVLRERSFDPNKPVDAEFEYFVKNVETTIANLVDSNVPNPQAHNIPKYYHDPRFRIITVMTRYLAAFQTTIIPKLYNDYIKDGNVGMRYQAFSVMIGALALSALANSLKDQLSYGEDSPYLNGILKNSQRTLYGSGLLGRGEVVVDAMMPLYNRKGPSLIDAVNPSDNSTSLGSWMYDTARNNSAPVAWADRLVQAGQYASEGEYSKAGKQVARAAPLVGSVPQTYDRLEELFTNMFKENK